MAEDSKFNLSLDRKLQSDVLLVAISSSQDIIACCFNDDISCHRLNWQRIWVHSFTKSNAEPSALCWRPDAGLLAIGFSDGRLVLLETERGEQHATVKTGAEGINHLSWVEEAPRGQREGIFQQISRCVKPDTKRIFCNALTMLCVGSEGSISIYTSGLSCLCQCSLESLTSSSVDKGRPTIVKVATDRSLNYIYVVWGLQNEEGIIEGQNIVVLQCSILHQARDEVFYISSTIEQQLESLRGLQGAVKDINKKWKVAADAIHAIRAAMMDSLQEMGHSPQDRDDIEQFERLVILGESACVPQIMSHFLVNKLGEAGLKQTAKAVDAALAGCFEMLVSKVQAGLEEVLSLCDMMGSALGCSSEIHDLGLEDSIVVELESLISQMVWQSVGIQAWVGELQTGWRIFFAWLLQRLHASDSIDTSKLPRPANTESVMRILTHWHSGVVSGNIFAVEESLSERSVAIGKLIQDKKHGSFEANLGRGVQLCEQSSEGILSTLSGQIGLLQQIHLPPTCRASSRAESSVSISLPQGKNDSGNGVYVSSLEPGTSSILIMNIKPPRAGTLQTHHAIATCRIRIGLDSQLAALQLMRQGSMFQALLHRYRERGGSITILPLPAEAFRELDRPIGGHKQVIPEDSRYDLQVERKHAQTNIADSNLQGPFAISGSRGVAVHLIGPRRVCIYLQED